MDEQWGKFKTESYCVRGNDRGESSLTSALLGRGEEERKWTKRRGGREKQGKGGRGEERKREQRKGNERRGGGNSKRKMRKGEKKRKKWK